MTNFLVEKRGLYRYLKDQSDIIERVSLHFREHSLQKHRTKTKEMQRVVKKPNWDWSSEELGYQGNNSSSTLSETCNGTDRV